MHTTSSSTVRTSLVPCRAPYRNKSSINTLSVPVAILLRQAAGVEFVDVDVECAVVLAHAGEENRSLFKQLGGGKLVEYLTVVVVVRRCSREVDENQSCK